MVACLLMLFGVVACSLFDCCICDIEVSGICGYLWVYSLICLGYLNCCITLVCFGYNIELCVFR